MMYSNKLAVAIKSNNKVLRESGDNVFLPYLSEYSIFIKNLHSTKVRVNISIDGKDVLDGKSLVIEAFSNLELERFYENNDNLSGRKFKFIEKTKDISEYLGDRVEDGLVVISYQFEEKNIPIPRIFSDISTYVDNNDYRTDLRRQSYPKGSISMNNVSGSLNRHGVDCQSLDAGITVGGSKSNQEFFTCSIGKMEYEKYSIVIKLLGIDLNNNNNIKDIISTKTKKICPTCGKKNKFSADYCSKCGTFIS